MVRSGTFDRRPPGPPTCQVAPRRTSSNEKMDTAYLDPRQLRCSTATCTAVRVTTSAPVPALREGPVSQLSAPLLLLSPERAKLLNGVVMLARLKPVSGSSPQ